MLEIIKKNLYKHGFDQVKVIARQDFPNISSKLHPWLEAGFHGELHWMVNNAEKRADPHKIWDQVESAFIVTLNYAPQSDPRPDFDHPEKGYISVYARHLDYHDIMKRRLKDVVISLKDQVNCRLFVDTAPIAEKPLAQKSGLGWQGKHTNLVSREFGSWLFLGVLLTDLKITQSDSPEIDHCGSCTKCLTACPTNAFIKPYLMDARRCISYLTIEYKDYIPDDLAVLMGNRIYGCDDCLAACPWNKFAQASHEIAFQARAEADNPPLETLLQLNEESFRKHYRKSPIKRIGYVRFMRNILIAAGNSKNKSLIPQVKSFINSAHIILHQTALFALNRLQ